MINKLKSAVCCLSRFFHIQQVTQHIGCH
jgi:hypothetical protein